MSNTSTASSVGTGPALTLFAGESVEVLGLDAADTLGMVVVERRAQDLAAARELKAVTHWADLHRVVDGTVGAVDRSLCVGLARPRVDPLLGREGQLRLLGQGAFTVEEFALTQLAAALGMSEAATRTYVGQGLELRDRLPKLWGKVMGGVLPAWKARQIAAETLPLNAAAAAYVDAHLASFAHQMSVARILRCVHAAVIRHDRDLAAERAAKAAEGRGVWVDDDLDGTSRITAVTTTPDAAAFEAAVHQVAGDLATLGSTAPEQVRRATAVGVLADPQHGLDLHATADAAHADAAEETRPRPRRTKQGPTLHLHLHTDAISGLSSGPTDGTGHVVRVDGKGPRSLAVIRQWLADLAPGTQVTVTPVVDLTEHISVDAYEIPDRLRRQVTERDDSCRFPWCGRQGRFDIDHIDPYVPMDEGGPPGQTSTSNTAKLCRFHHRVKTHGDWRYRRDDPTTVTWTSRLGHVYTVDQHGTIPRTGAPKG